MYLLLTLISLFALGLPQMAHGDEQSDRYNFYLKVGSGISISQSADITAPYPPWNPAEQGYNANLGYCPISAFTVGCQIFDVADLEVSVANRSMFTYQQFQTSTTDDQSYTREFNLSVTPILFSANILGKGIPSLHWGAGSKGTIYPMFGAGIGVSNLLITNFRTTGLPPSGSSSPFASFSSENQYILRQNFTYTLLVGVEYNHHDRWAFGTGYRWLNAGSFDGPQYLRTESGAAVDVAQDAWNMRFRANEWFIEFKIFI